MLPYFFSLPDKWAHMLHPQVPPYHNTSIHFEYVLLTNNRYAPLGGPANIPGHACLPPNLYPVPNLELVLGRDTPKPTLLDDLLKLLSNCFKDHSLLVLEGTFSTLGNCLEPDQSFPDKELQDLLTEFSTNRFPDCHHAHLIPTFDRLQVLYLEFHPWKIY
jgi:hypothetical protein